MRLIAGTLLILITALIGIYFYVLDIPYYKYSKWVKGEGNDRYFEISQFRDLYLNPVAPEKIPHYQEDYVQLWKEFPLRNSIIPMPTRHPMFQTIPIIEMNGKIGTPTFGIILLDSNGREVTRVYTLPNRLSHDHTQGQELFKYPYVRNRILKKDLGQLWKDIFSYKIEIKDKPIDEMIYDLYIVHLRSKILPKETLKYGLIKDGKQALIELLSKDKDYIVELVMTMDSGSIFSYVLKTEKNRPESVKVRAKLLESVTFSPIDEAIGGFLYTEFKQLNYARQIDQEGMLYLYTAWSQNPDNLELLKEMIYYLERGGNTKKQLSVLYAYSFKRYGKTFTTRQRDNGIDGEDIVLQKKIELEEMDTRRKIEESSHKIPEPVLSPDEKMNMYLKKAKQEKLKETKDMTVH